MTALVFSPGRLRGWMHVRGIQPAALADAVQMTTAYVQACAYGHPVARPPTAVVLAAWARPARMRPRRSAQHDPTRPQRVLASSEKPCPG